MKEASRARRISSNERLESAMIRTLRGIDVSSASAYRAVPVECQSTSREHVGIRPEGSYSRYKSSRQRVVIRNDVNKTADVMTSAVSLTNCNTYLVLHDVNERVTVGRVKEYGDVIHPVESLKSRDVARIFMRKKNTNFVGPQVHLL